MSVINYRAVSFFGFFVSHLIHVRRLALGLCRDRNAPHLTVITLLPALALSN